MASLLKGFLVSLCLFIIIGCGATKSELARQQSLVVDLTIQCSEKKNEDACDKLSIEVKRLREMLK